MNKDGSIHGLTTHGESSKETRTQEYRSWAAMKNRCSNPNNAAFADYGGRGIVVCERWSSSYPNFLEDMGRRPSKYHSIDRINNNGNYEPGNCRWATASEQALNTRRTTSLTWNGETMSVKEWAERIGMDPKTLYARVDLGWSTERILTEPLDAERPVFTKTHCKHGHEFTPENTMIVGPRARQCRECARTRGRSGYHRRKDINQCLVR